MEDLKIIVLNFEKVSFKNKDTGEIKEFLHVSYATPVPENKRFSGLAVMECNCDINNSDLLKSYFGKPVTANVNIYPNKNGVKYSLISIDKNELV